MTAAVALLVGFLLGVAFTAWMAVERDDGIGSEGEAGSVPSSGSSAPIQRRSGSIRAAGRVALVHEGGDQAHRREAGAQRGGRAPL